ncbi:MAG: winged helix-turn-helix transcriptional regulator [Anaerolineales bacterium]|nr:winged helix-turn-helix transcriptional regulator [Anaerolineales bacterium]
MYSSTTPESQMEALLRRLASLRLMRPPQDCELSPPMVGILFWVLQSPGCGVLDLAEGLKVTPPTVSVGVMRLVKDGWLESRRDPEDRRAKPLYLTEKSETLLEQLRMYQREAFKIFLSGLIPAEQEMFISLFDKALSAIEEALDGS